MLAHLLLALLLPSAIHGLITPFQETQITGTISLRVYRDGVVHVTQTVTVDENIPTITMRLLASSLGNILVIDQQRKTFLSYEIAPPNITINALGTREILIEYDTSALTRKEENVWTVSLNASLPVQVKLPAHATIVYLSDNPLSTATVDDAPFIYLRAGRFEISYYIPLTEEMQPPQREIQLSSYLLSILLGLATCMVVIFLWRRRRMIEEDLSLRDRDLEVLEFIKLRGGAVMEGELREHLHLPKTSVWRMVKRLERMEKIKVKKRRFQNEIKLV